jgi:DNA invertase Pin-like site-specific DNA recombinase
MQVRKLKLKRPKISLLRVAAYARVSHDAIGMRNSFESQINHYANYIQKHKSWEYVGVYADYARTGTKVSARPEFQRLMADCDEGKIDLVLCKSVSRFGRNTVELLHNIRHLRDLNIEVRFEEEGISTVSPSCELILTMISAVAENEIRDMSSNIKWAINKKFKEGKLNGIPLINGYKWDSGILVIDDEGATMPVK